MSDRGVAPLLGALQSPNSCGSAWAEFLDSYSPVLYHTARACTSDEDAVADCYVHICERLSRNGFRRLLKFKPEGGASFTTWLRVVARNLCFDWHRSQSGRPRPFRSLQHLSALELEVYDYRFVHRASRRETLYKLASRFPHLGLSELSEIEARLQALLTPRQNWILASRRQPAFIHPEALAGDDEGEPVGTDVTDPGPTPENWFADRQIHTQLQNSVASLPARERLLLQLRFEQELSLTEIARLCGLRDAQSVHRNLTAILKKLRDALEYDTGKIQSRVRAIE